jgi:8-oxo-dGTP pyrophosphatase MutT (NUDIX family)
MAPASPDSRHEAAIPALPAATVMLVRDAAPLEVFVLGRNVGAAFAAGFYVFPGGKVDPGDGGAAVEPFTDGPDDATASATLGVESGGLAYWVAAIRECFEEAGVLLARRRDGGPPAPRHDDRRRVHDGSLSLVELCRRDDLVLATASLRYVAHWITPLAERPRRFDTRFFLAAAPAGQDGSHDEGETVDSRWVAPADALAQAAAGELLLMPPTIAQLRFLAGCSDVADALARADAAGPPPRILPTLAHAADGTPLGVRLDDGTFYPMPRP